MPLDIFQAATTEMLLLLFLSKEDAHGYQLAQMIKERCGGFLEVKSASLYPILYKLEEKGCVTGKESFVERKSEKRSGRSARVRIVYHLEPPGFERLQILLEEHEALVKGCAAALAFMGKGGESDEE